MITSGPTLNHVFREEWQKQYIVTSRQVMESYCRLLYADGLVTAVAPKRGQLTLPLEPKS